ncbi:unnamed protein product, partial [Brassica oleracea var. botrytis]
LTGIRLSSSRVFSVWSVQRLEWTSSGVMAGPGRCQPCFACSPFRSRLRDGLRCLRPFSDCYLF